MRALDHSAIGQPPRSSDIYFLFYSLSVWGYSFLCVSFITLWTIIVEWFYESIRPLSQREAPLSWDIHFLFYSLSVWGYSFLCVTFINLCAIIGIIFIPFMKHKFYQVLLMFMVALAVGTLAGSSLLFLIPDVSMNSSFHRKLSSGVMILLTITFELGIILQNIWRRVVGNVLINISPSNILPIVLKPDRFLQNCQAGFGRCEH